MGGSAFASAPYLLNTPRMPPAIYHKVKSACHACLQELYVYVASPIEGPGKENHGDVDIIVFLEQQAATPSGPEPQLPQLRDGHEPLERIAVALGAEHVIYQKPHLTGANMAIPWPDEEENTSDRTVTDGAPQTKRRHVQVDVHTAQCLAELQWRLFRHAHGDLWQLVGTTIRPLGLTIDEEALWVRIPEIEARDRKRSKIFLTADPAEVLQFLGYKGYADMASEEEDADVDTNPDVDGEHTIGIPDDDCTHLHRVWDRPFPTVTALFRYVTTSRWFSVRPPQPSEPHSNPGPLRSNDRRRLKQRRVYAQWAEHYLPSLPPCTAGFGLLPLPDKQLAVRDAAFERWPAARQEYVRRREDFRLQVAGEEQRGRITRCIRETVAGFGRGESWSGVAVGALRKVVFSGDAGFGVVPAVSLRDERGLFDVGEAEKFVREMGLDVGRRAWEIMCARGRQAAEEKARKGAVLAETGSEAAGGEVQEVKKSRSDAGGVERGADAKLPEGGVLLGDEGSGV